ncbi:MAG TPA: hypothetical protein VFP35_00500 [Candidatus Saccharimonadales bacterium]|nr:hypothetical protein [Candidatus Saccharimonadales bacterium]
MAPQVNLAPNDNQPRPAAPAPVPPASIPQPQPVSQPATHQPAPAPPLSPITSPQVAQPQAAAHEPAATPQPAPAQAHPAAPAPAQAAADTSGPEPIIPQIVQDIPVHAPGQPGPAPANPFMPAPAAVTHSQTEEDDLDKILQAVNTKVKIPQVQDKSKSALPKPKLKFSIASLMGLFKGPRPVGVLAVTAIVVLALIALAVLAYRNPHHTASYQPGKVGTSSSSSDAIQQAGGTLVRPSDLDDYANGLQSKLNSLNDSQDFDSQALSNQNLGL